MPIQDNLHGALLISAIDFILSFVIIGGIGVILSLFPLLNRLNKQSGEGLVTTPPAAAGPGLTAVSPAISPSIQSAATSGIHPGLSDQQLVVLLTAAAYEVLGKPVRVDRFRPLAAKDWNWAAQGRHDLQSHRLK
jgi:hypothetical protein